MRPSRPTFTSSRRSSGFAYSIFLGGVRTLISRRIESSSLGETGGKRGSCAAESIAESIVACISG